MVLTVVNLVIVGIGACLVCPNFPILPHYEIANFDEVWHGSLGVW